MKKSVVIAALMMLALLMGVAGTAVRPDKAEARPSDVMSFNPNVCMFLAAHADWDTVISPVDLNGDGDNDATDNAIWACINIPVTGSGLTNPDNLAALADALGGDVDNPDTYADLVDYTAAQLGDDDDFDQDLWVLTFVTNDTPLHLDADEGVWLSTGLSSSQTDCEPAVAVGIEDEDCDNDGAWGDGVVVDLLSGADAAGTSVADLGDAIVTATQTGIDVEMDYTVVGVPDDLILSATKATISENAGTACDLWAITGQIALPDVTGLLATVTDEDGTPLTGIWVDWDSSDDVVVNFARIQEDAEPGGAVSDVGEPITSTVSISSGGVVVALNLGCGGDTGMATATAAVTENDAIDDEVDITVVGAPASMTLAANPAAMVCDGVNSSTVAATLTDSLGNLVADGTPVRFSVQGPATVNPILAWTVGGVASTSVVGLSGIATLLPVSVTSGDLEASIGVACTAPPPSPVGDVNCDGQVSMVDAMLIAQKVAGLIEEFPCM